MEAGKPDLTATLIFGLTLSTAIGCGLMSGVFFTFSAFVMTALARLPSSQGIAAMQSINVAIINPLFMVVFMGTAASCAVLLVFTLSHWQRPEAVFLLAGCLLYLAGAIAVTMAFNVPRNDMLGAINPAAPEASAAWSNFVKGWTAWNHVRTIASVAATVSFLLALNKSSTG